MEWINEPPSYAMTLKLSDPAGGKLELVGPATSERVKGGIIAAVGATFSTAALPFFRAPFPAPIPWPFKLVPLAVGLVGGGIGALGVAIATGEASVLFERKKGVRFRWKLGPLPQRELFVPAKEIAEIELSRTVRHSEDRHGFSTTSVHYQLHVVTTSGKAVAFESFPLQAQAKLRQTQIERVMRPTRKTAGARKPAGARKAR
jgi:hypothetical protein